MWTSPYTWSVGEVVTAAKMNEQLRDNQAHIYDGTLWAAADGSAVNAACTNLVEVGSKGLTVTSDRITIPTGGDGVYLLACQVYGGGWAYCWGSIHKNGSPSRPGTSANVGNGTNANGGLAAESLVAGDYVQIAVGAWNAGAGSYQSADGSIYVVRLFGA